MAIHGTPRMCQTLLTILLLRLIFSVKPVTYTPYYHFTEKKTKATVEQLANRQTTGKQQS